MILDVDVFGCMILKFKKQHVGFLDFYYTHTKLDL